MLILCLIMIKKNLVKLLLCVKNVELLHRLKTILMKLLELGRKHFQKIILNIMMIAQDAAVILARKNIIN